MLVMLVMQVMRPTVAGCARGDLLRHHDCCHRRCHDRRPRVRYRRTRIRRRVCLLATRSRCQSMAQPARSHPPFFASRNDCVTIVFHKSPVQSSFCTQYRPSGRPPVLRLPERGCKRRRQRCPEYRARPRSRTRGESPSVGVPEVALRYDTLPPQYMIWPVERPHDLAYVDGAFRHVFVCHRTQFRRSLSIHTRESETR